MLRAANACMARVKHETLRRVRWRNGERAREREKSREGCPTMYIFRSCDNPDSSFSFSPLFEDSAYCFLSGLCRQVFCYLLILCFSRSVLCVYTYTRPDSRLTHPLATLTHSLIDHQYTIRVRRPPTVLRKTDHRRIITSTMAATDTMGGHDKHWVRWLLFFFSMSSHDFFFPLSCFSVSPSALHRQTNVSTWRCQCLSLSLSLPLSLSVRTWHHSPLLSLRILQGPPTSGISRRGRIGKVSDSALAASCLVLHPTRAKKGQGPRGTPSAGRQRFCTAQV